MNDKTKENEGDWLPDQQGKDLEGLHNDSSTALQDFTKSEKMKYLKESNSSQENVYDKHIGKLVARLRFAAGMSQKDLADIIGISRRKLKRHEAGEDCIGCGRMKLIAEALCIPVSTFFETTDVIHGKNIRKVKKCRKDAEDIFGQFMALEIKEHLGNGKAELSESYALIKERLKNLANDFVGIDKEN